MERLTFLAGKGGVGKTTCAASLALQIAKEKRCTAISVDPAHTLRDVFAREKPPSNLKIETINTRDKWLQFRESLGEEIERVNPVDAAEADYKTMLQEKLQAERRLPPQYKVVETIGPPHRRTFHVELVWDRGSVRGEGRSIKVAEAVAACRALENMKADPASAGILAESDHAG